MKKEMDILPVMVRQKMQSNQNVSSEYEKMGSTIRAAPLSICRFKELFCKILKNYTETHGEILISNDGKVTYFARNGTPITNFVAIPLSVMHQFSEDGTEDYVELLIMGEGVPVKTITIRSRDMGSAKWIDDLGVNYIYEKREVWNIRVIIQQMARYAPIREEYLYSGWDPNGDNFYVMNRQKVYGDDWSEEGAKLSCKHTLQMLDIAPHSLTIVLLAIVILSLVHSKMVNRGIYFKGVCCIVAQSQSFKTTLASLFFDLADGRKTDISFESSMAAIIRTIGNSRDSTVVLDDYKPGATKAECRDMLQKISTVIRLCSDDSGGIKRAGVQNETVANVARCLVVVTAEHIHFDVQSTCARLLTLELNGKNVDEDKITYFQENHALYRACIEDFIKYIIRQNVDIFCEKLEQKFLQGRNTLQKKLFDRNVLVDNRTNDMCAWLNIAFSEFLKYTLSMGAITQEGFGKYMEESQAIFLSLMKQQAERVAELDGVRQFFKGLQILLETKEVHIGNLLSRNTNYATADSRSAIGFRKKGFVYLKNDVAFQKVASYFQRCGREFAFSETELRKRLVDRGFINQKDGKGYIHRLSVNHESYQCIQFVESKFNKLLRGGKNYEEAEREIPSDRVLQENANAILGRGI